MYVIVIYLWYIDCSRIFWCWILYNQKIYKRVMLSKNILQENDVVEMLCLPIIMFCQPSVPSGLTINYLIYIFCWAVAVSDLFPCSRLPPALGLTTSAVCSASPSSPLTPTSCWGRTRWRSSTSTSSAATTSSRRGSPRSWSTRWPSDWQLFTSTSTPSPTDWTPATRWVVRAVVVCTD